VFVKRGLPTLRQEGVQKMLDGLTTLEELDRITHVEVAD
jgi:type II secretory ATPase GspE/PulE/Tfp pilus assembly ATPase PilB-like protein